MPRASEPDSHPSEWRTGLGRSGGGRLGSMLLSAGSDVTFDPSPAEGAEIGCRAVAGIGRYFVGIASEVRLDAIEQRRKVWLITAVVTERVRHDDLIIRIHCSLRVVALDVAVLGLENSALGIGEVALRFRLRFLRWRRCFAARSRLIVLLLPCGLL